MRQSQLLLPTLKENPADAEAASHRLMLRAGLIRQVAAGIYTWLPLGLRVLRKIERILREELNASGAQELLMPVVQPAELWEETGRWEKMGPELARLKDRNARDFCLGPTHEEIITDVFRREIHSYKQLPCNFYQIQTKFRDEIRPRFGVMRAREFTMKDGYSFDADQASFDRSYQSMFDCYTRILTRMRLDFRAVEADSGNIGGSNSHEFQVLAESGEDTIVYASEGDYAANLEKAVGAPPPDRPAPAQSMTTVDTPDCTTIAAVGRFLELPETRCVKTMIVRGEDSPIAIVLRGDHELNEIKAEKLPGVRVPLEFAGDDEIIHSVGCPPGSIGPVDLPIPFFVDPCAAAIGDFCCGANEEDRHHVNVNWDRDVDLSSDRIIDARNVVEGEPAPGGQGILRFLKGIEAGHIFQLGQIYSESMNATVLDRDGKPLVPIMGCYGMGVTRLVAAIIEQNHDEVGIKWPTPVAPFLVHIVALNYGKSESVRAAADELYKACLDQDMEVLLDDTDDRPGVKFADADLIGLPHRITVGERALADGNVEYKARGDAEASAVPLAEILTHIAHEEANAAS
jgi:prolyl-tRNA synthetase